MNLVNLAGEPGSVKHAAADNMVSHARATVESGINELRGHIQGSSSAIRAGSFIGGMSVVVVAFLNVLNIFRIAYDITYLVNVYQLLFGLVTLFLEGKSSWLGVSRIQEAIYKEAHFLSTVSGRAMFYLFQGSLFIIQNQFFAVIVGAYMSILGCIMLYQGGTRGFVTSADDALMEPLGPNQDELRMRDTPYEAAYQSDINDQTIYRTDNSVYRSSTEAPSAPYYSNVQDSTFSTP